MFSFCFVFCLAFALFCFLVCLGLLGCFSLWAGCLNIVFLFSLFFVGFSVLFWLVWLFVLFWLCFALRCSQTKKQFLVWLCLCLVGIVQHKLISVPRRGKREAQSLFAT